MASFLCLPQVFGFFRPSFSLYLPSVNKQPSKGGGQKNERKLFYCQSCLRKKYCCILQVTTLPQFGFDLHKYPHSVWKSTKNVSYLKASISLKYILWRHRCFFGRNGSDAPYARKNWKWDFLVIFNHCTHNFPKKFKISDHHTAIFAPKTPKNWVWKSFLKWDFFAEFQTLCCAIFKAFLHIWLLEGQLGCQWWFLRENDYFR